MLAYNDSIDNTDALRAYLDKVGAMIDSLLNELGMDK